MAGSVASQFSTDDWDFVVDTPETGASLTLKRHDTGRMTVSTQRTNRMPEAIVLLGHAEVHSLYHLLGEALGGTWVEPEERTD